MAAGEQAGGFAPAIPWLQLQACTVGFLPELITPAACTSERSFRFGYPAGRPSSVRRSAVDTGL